MYYYTTNLKGSSSVTTPFIVLVDGDNKIRGWSEGTQTAEGIKRQIDLFNGSADPGTSAPPSENLPGYENPTFIFRSIDEKNISTKTSSGQATLLVFGTTDCSNTKNTLTDIANSSWISRSDIRVVFGEYNYASKSDVSSYAQQFANDKIIFCYDEENYIGGIQDALWDYLSLIKSINEGVQSPLTVLIDTNNRVRKIWEGKRTAAELLSAIDQCMTSAAPSTPTTPAATSTTAPASSTDSIPNVSGLRSSSGTNNIKLSWNKVSGAEGYLIYQYTSSKWKRVATVTSKKTSYNITKLKAGTNYRFGVKAYYTKNKKQVLSKSYSSLYSSTKPTAVSFKITAGRKRAKLTWSKVKGATGYIVYYKTSSKGSWKKLKTTKKTSFTQKKLKSNKTYIFTVKAYKTYKGKTYTSSYRSKKVTIK